MAIKRLMECELSVKDREVADCLVEFFMKSKDDVTQGAWYPDSVYKDNASGHVLKFTPVMGFDGAATTGGEKRGA